MIDGSFFNSLITTGRFGDITGAQMGIAYFLHSGKKTVSSLVEEYLDSSGEVTQAGAEIIASLLENYFGDRWDRIYSALQTEYEPLENYDRISEITDTESGTNNSTIGSQQNTTGNTHDEMVHSVSPYDSNTFNAESKDVAESDARTNTLGQRQDSITFGHKNTHNEHTHGNIGVTTSQQMLESEWNLRRKDFLNEIIKDVDSFLTLSVY